MSTLFEKLIKQFAYKTPTEKKSGSPSPNSEPTPMGEYQYRVGLQTNVNFSGDAMPKNPDRTPPVSRNVFSDFVKNTVTIKADAWKTQYPERVPETLRQQLQEAESELLRVKIQPKETKPKVLSIYEETGDTRTAKLVTHLDWDGENFFNHSSGKLVTFDPYVTPDELRQFGLTVTKIAKKQEASTHNAVEVFRQDLMLELARRLGVLDATENNAHDSAIVQLQQLLDYVIAYPNRTDAREQL